jgi:enamine deaminase RidA (YjgF/YER057c/UK114 family)
MQKRFTAIVPTSMEALSKHFQFSPAVRVGSHILVSGIIGVDPQGRLPADFRRQAENVLATLEAIVSEAGATMDDVVSLNSYHVGDLQSQLAQLAEVKAGWLGAPPYPIWTGVGVAQLAMPGALLEVSAVVQARGPVSAPP